MTHKKSILLVEDDNSLARLTQRYLASHAFEVTVAADGESGLQEANKMLPDLIILDLMLPKIDGVTLCGKIRDFYSGPILVLTAKSDTWTELDCFSSGADDFAVKPVVPEILLARITALLRRTHGNTELSTDIIESGSVRIDQRKRELHIDGVKADLHNAEYELLCLLATHAGTVMSRDEIYLALRGIEYDGVDRMVDLRVSKLRTLLATGIHSPEIKTVRGKGYLFAMVD